MTKEQAMKIMNEWNKCEELVIRENTDYDKTIYIQRKEAIDTVLNMLKEKDELYHKALGDLVKADRENIQLNRQINLMARAIDNYDSQLEINTFKDKEEVKQYFKEIAERKSEE